MAKKIEKKPVQMATLNYKWKSSSLRPMPNKTKVVAKSK